MDLFVVFLVHNVLAQEKSSNTRARDWLVSVGGKVFIQFYNSRGDTFAGNEALDSRFDEMCGNIVSHEIAFLFCLDGTPIAMLVVSFVCGPNTN